MPMKSTTPRKRAVAHRAVPKAKAKPVKVFSDEYLELCKKVPPADILAFLESFRKLQSTAPCKSKRISLNVPANLFAAFQHKAKLVGASYQAQIKTLMREWVDS